MRENVKSLLPEANDDAGPELLRCHGVRDEEDGPDLGPDGVDDVVGLPFNGEGGTRRRKSAKMRVPTDPRARGVLTTGRG